MAFSPTINNNDGQNSTIDSFKDSAQETQSAKHTDVYEEEQCNKLNTTSKQKNNGHFCPYFSSKPVSINMEMKNDLTFNKHAENFGVPQLLIPPNTTIFETVASVNKEPSPHQDCENGK